MSAIGHVLEQEGLATVSVSLVREHSVKVRPPRALWVSFELGRPFGGPNDARQQTRVLKQALNLLERRDGPVILEDSDEHAAPASAQESAGLFCMLSLPTAVPPLPDNASPQDQLIARVKAELTALTPWHQLASEQKNGRSTTGVSGLQPAQIIEFLAALLYGKPATAAPGKDLAQTLRFGSEDLRSWYLEAAAARPGEDRRPLAATNWFWGNTAAGELLLELQAICSLSADEALRVVAAGRLVPRSQGHRLLNKNPR